MNDLISYSAQYGVSTDTRSLRPGQVFFALKGPNFDGNKYAVQALEKGASMAVVDDPGVAVNRQYVLVENVLETLQQVASAYRDTLEIPIIAICGSNGKTTTKELAHAVLSRKYRCFATKGNLNNHIGVPLSILAIPKDAEIAILEIGSNHLQETAQLCRIAKPTHGIITNNGLDHLEGFGSLEGVIKANGELFDFLKLFNGYAFVNTLEKSVVEQSKSLINIIYFPSAGDYYHCVLEDSAGILKLRTETGKSFSTGLIGAYNFANLAAALCMGKYFGVDELQAIEAVSVYRPGNNRSQLIERNGITILLDAYNANPSSVEQALRSFQAMDYAHKYLLLGDMLELGAFSRASHLDILQLILNLGFKHVVLVGAEFGRFHKEFPQFTFFEEKSLIPDRFFRDFAPGAAILVKGSRGMKMEELEKKIL